MKKKPLCRRYYSWRSFDDLENKTRVYVSAMREARGRFGMADKYPLEDDVVKSVEEAGLVHIRDLVRETIKVEYG